MSEQLTTEQLIDRFAQTQGVSKEEAEKLVGAETTEEILDNIKKFTQSKINEVLRPKNRAQRRAAAKSMGRKKREKKEKMNKEQEKEIWRKKKIMKQLLKTTEVYRVDTEEEALAMIEDAKDGQLTNGYTVTKSGYVLKTKKAKGEVVDSWMVTSIEKTFND